MAIDIDFSPLARYTQRQAQKEDEATKLLMGQMHSAGKVFEPILRQGFSQQIIAEAGDKPWQAANKLASYNPEMYKSFAPEAKQAHIANIAQTTDFAKKLQELDELSNKVITLKKEKQAFSEAPLGATAFDENRFVTPVTADANGMLRPAGKSQIDEELDLAETQRNILQKELSPVLKLDNETGNKVLNENVALKAKQNALINEGYIEEARRLEGNLLSDDQRMLNALGKTNSDISAKITDLERDLRAPNLSDKDKAELTADINTLRNLSRFLNMGKAPATLDLNSWVLAGRNNANLDFTKSPFEQGDEIVDFVETSLQTNPQSQDNIYSNENTLQGAKNIFMYNLQSESFTNNKAKEVWLNGQLDLFKKNPNLNDLDKSAFEGWAKSEMTKVGTQVGAAVAENARKLNLAKDDNIFTTFNTNYNKNVSAFTQHKPKTNADILKSLAALKRELDKDPNSKIVEIFGNAVSKILKVNVNDLFTGNVKATKEDWNKIVSETFIIPEMDKWLKDNEKYMTQNEKEEVMVRVNSAKGLLMREPKKAIVKPTYNMEW